MIVNIGNNLLTPFVNQLAKLARLRLDIVIVYLS